MGNSENGQIDFGINQTRHEEEVNTDVEYNQDGKNRRLTQSAIETTRTDLN